MDVLETILHSLAVVLSVAACTGVWFLSKKMTDLEWQYSRDVMSEKSKALFLHDIHLKLIKLQEHTHGPAQISDAPRG